MDEKCKTNNGVLVGPEVFCWATKGGSVGRWVAVLHYPPPTVTTAHTYADSTYLPLLVKLESIVHVSPAHLRLDKRGGQVFFTIYSA